SALDLRYGTPRTIIGQPEVPMGILPGAGGTSRLPRLLGRDRALEIMLTGRDVDATEALAIGWLTGLYAGDEIERIVMALARRVARMPAASVAAVKRVVDLSLGDLRPVLTAETDAFGELTSSGAHLEPMRRFLEAGGAVKSGSPISMCTTRRPAASSACARASTSITWKGSMSAARCAASRREGVKARAGKSGGLYGRVAIIFTRVEENDVDEQLKANALEYHSHPRPGKISILPTKQLTNQRDLGLAYSPGVAAACEEIVRDPAQAMRLTSRANLIAVITNGTAVLGLGAIGPLAAKPVMEGKSVLFKKFAGIDCFDIEVNERDPEKLVEIIAALEPTFGGINLEDIKAPECFIVERKLRARLKIPVFHDDQHGTAITVGAAVLNGLKVVGKDLARVQLVVSGAGAAALACLGLLVRMGMPLANITVTDIKGVVYKGRKEEMDPDKERYAKDTRARTLDEVIGGADVFLGLSAGGVLKPAMVKKMAERPLILALANPEPEIRPELAREARPDCVIATGRSDYPNQVNNVLCFPFIFRGALDVGATTITHEMELAAVRAIAELAQAETSEQVAQAYGIESISFGPEYLIPRPFDPRLIARVAPAVAQAAMASGVATRPIADLAAYRESLAQFVYHSGLIMKPLFAAAKTAPKRVVYAEGEDERVLRAVQIVVDEGLAQPVLVGRPQVVEQRIERLGLRVKPGREFQLVNPELDPRYRDYWMSYHKLTERKGVSPEYARIEMRRRATLIGAMMMYKGEADGMLCGTFGTHALHLHYVDQVIGLAPGVRHYAAMNALVMPGRTVFICDTYVTPDPDAEHIAEMTVLAAEEVRRFGIVPKVALLSASNFGSLELASSRKMQRALALLQERAPQLEVEGEMHGDAALSEEIRLKAFPSSRFRGQANLLIMPTLDAANISFNLLKTAAADGVTIGPILLGAARAVHILTPSATVRRIVNMTALAVVDANAPRAGVEQRLF
ncbi:MAG TPA: NADP-dependent malic enzyme, partial [Burkholderiales bacterium]|nr:NADP-dependent malic enzyme [Burkholderiales bacterium]